LRWKLGSDFGALSEQSLAVRDHHVSSVDAPHQTLSRGLVDFAGLDER
jgi:hypothetical protein